MRCTSQGNKKWKFKFTVTENVQNIMSLDKSWKPNGCYIIAQFHSSQFLCQKSEGKALISVIYWRFIISNNLSSGEDHNIFRSAWSILLYCHIFTLSKLKFEHNFVTIIYCCKNHYIILGNHTILSEVCWTSKSYSF